jgi:hypothetical protein
MTDHVLDLLVETREGKEEAEDPDHFEETLEMQVKKLEVLDVTQPREMPGHFEVKDQEETGHLEGNHHQEERIEARVVESEGVDGQLMLNGRWIRIKRTRLDGPQTSETRTTDLLDRTEMAVAVGVTGAKVEEVSEVEDTANLHMVLREIAMDLPRDTPHVQGETARQVLD